MQINPWSDLGAETDAICILNSLKNDLQRGPCTRRDLIQFPESNERQPSCHWTISAWIMRVRLSNRGLHLFIWAAIHVNVSRCINQLPHWHRHRMHQKYLAYWFLMDVQSWRTDLIYRVILIVSSYSVNHLFVFDTQAFVFEM